MAFKLSQRSLDRLDGVEEDLVRVVKRAIEITEVDFGVIQGLRTIEEQEALVAKGASQTMKSKHLEGRAVDLMAYVGGKGSWELAVYDEVADAMKKAAEEECVQIRWGAAWHIDDIREHTDTMEEAMNGYIDLRRSQGRRPFIDAPHFELMVQDVEYRSVFISDIHLGTKSCKAKKLLTFLSTLETERLFLVGDIIDGWKLQRSHYWTKTQTEVIRKILKISESTDVIYIPGNHDEFVRPFFKYDFQFGRTQVCDTYDYIDLNGRKIYVCHGDKFDFWMHVPKNIINFFGHFTDWTEKADEAGTSINRYIRRTSTESALRKFRRIRGYDSVICGHTHYPMCEEEYMNCGDWVKQCSAIVETHEGEWRLIYAD